MITEKGIIEKVARDRAFVRVQKGSACASCSQKNACRIDGDRPMVVEVANELGAQAGDWVELSMPSTSLMKISIAVYFVPVLALVLGAVLGSQWADTFRVSPTTAAMIAGGAALAVCFSLLKQFDRAARRKPGYYPTMTRILSSSEAPSECDYNK